MNYNEEDPENLGRQSDQQSFAEFLKLLKDEFGELLRTRLLNDRIVNYFNGATIHNLVINGNMNKGGMEYYEADSRVQEEPQPMVVRRPTDDMIIEGVRRCQAFFWAGAAWAVVYRVLQSDYDESRSVNQFEEDMFLPSEGLNYRCSPRTKTMKKIQYSVAMRPNPMHEGDPKKAYATLQLTGQVSLADLAQHISEHNSVFSKGTTVGILTELSVCIRELLLQGYSIDLGDLGRLTPSITSTGATTLKDFTADNIQKVNVKFTNGRALLKLREDAEFEQTTSRAAQAAALKASKEGLTTADWTPQEGEGGEGGEEEEPEP